MVGSKIYENDSYLRAVVGNYRESGAMQFKKFDFFLISPKDPFGKLFLKTVTECSKVLAKPRFCEK